MGGVFATIDFQPENRARADTPAADTRPEPGLLESLAGGFSASRADTTGYNQEQREAAYADLIEGLSELGYPVEDYVFPSRAGSGMAYARIYADALREKARGRFKDLPDSQAAFEEQWRQRTRERVAAAEDTAARGNAAAAFVGGVAGAMTDPINLYTLPIGGTGRTVAQRVLSEALINMGVEAALQPTIAAQRAELGRRELTPGEAALNVGMAGVGAAAIRGGIEVAPGAARALDGAGYRALAPVREAFDRFFADRDLARALSDAVPEHLRTPDQADALRVLTREVEIDEASPYVRTHEGDALHRTRLREATAQLERPRPARTSGNLHGGIVSFFEQAGLPRSVARGIAAGIEAESRSNPAIVNPTSGAFGIGQWLGARKAELFRRYGRSPSMRQQLEFLLWELRGGDHGGAKVLGQADEAAVLRSYIVDFMRPAKGAETTGDLSRGMAALGRGEEPLPIGAGGASELVDDGSADVLDALRAEEADIAAARARESGEELVPDAPTIDAATMRTGLARALEPLIDDRSVSLNRTAELADELGVSEVQLREALDDLVAGRRLSKTTSGLYRRRADRGPEDMLTFIARSGGIAYDGLGPKARAAGHRGDDLRNTGTLQHFVPGAGPLLRPGGRGVDEIGERLWDAGYFGPPSTTARPSEAEVLVAIEDAVRSGEKRFSSFEARGAAPERNRAGEEPPIEETPGPPDDEAFWQMVDRISDAAGPHMVMPDDAVSIAELMRAGIPVHGAREFEPDMSIEEIAPYVSEYLNRRIDEALDDAFLEVEDALYDGAAAQIGRETGEAGEAAAGGAGRTADAGDPGEGAGGAGSRGAPGAGGPADRLTPSQIDALAADPSTGSGDLGPSAFADPALARRFDDDAGDGVRAIAESDWHDIRAAQDPNIADRQRQEAQLGAEAPLRAKSEQDGTMGLGLFDAADQPTFDLDHLETFRGKGPRTAAEIEAEIAADRAALEEIRKCMK